MLWFGTSSHMTALQNHHEVFHCGALFEYISAAMASLQRFSREQDLTNWYL